MKSLAVRMLVGLFALAFVALIERGARDRSKSRPTFARAAALGVALLVLAPLHASAAEALEPGAVLRIQTSGVAPGWHRGRALLDTRKCWMVKFDQPTAGYTMVALSFVRAAEVHRAGVWTPIDLHGVVHRQRAECLEEGSD